MASTGLRIVLLSSVTFATSLGEAAAAEPPTDSPSANRVASQLFRHQYTVNDRAFCGCEVCVDFDNNGQRELLVGSRSPGRLQLRNAADGSLLWTRALKGQQQSTYFNQRGRRQNVANQTDNLVLARAEGSYADPGRFVTELLTLQPGCEFRQLQYTTRSPLGT